MSCAVGPACGAPAPSASPRRPRNPSASKSCSPWQTSSGTSSTTGPGRPEVATAKARRTSSGMRLVRSTRISSLHGGPEDLDLARLPGSCSSRNASRLRVADDRDHRHAGVERLDQPGDEVGGAGPERRVAHAGPVGHARIGVGGERAAALVVDQEVLEPERARRRRRTAAAGSRPCRTSARPCGPAIIRASASPPVISFVDMLAPSSPLPACGERWSRRSRPGEGPGAPPSPSPSLRCAALASDPTRGPRPSPRKRGEEKLTLAPASPPLQRSSPRSPAPHPRAAARR